MMGSGLTITSLQPSPSNAQGTQKGEKASGRSHMMYQTHPVGCNFGCFSFLLPSCGTAVLGEPRLGNQRAGVHGTVLGGSGLTWKAWCPSQELEDGVTESLV